ncbi:hypothetical protein YQE_12264, partial [Dendroctonus ponderosae]
MPKKKTGQRKKAEKQRLRQKEIRTAKENVQLAQHPCNSLMECEKCNRKQKSRAFCYFCQSIQRLPVCAQCGKMKCMLKTGDCVIRHAGVFTTGMAMVVRCNLRFLRSLGVPWKEMLAVACLHLPSTRSRLLGVRKRRLGAWRADFPMLILRRCSGFFVKMTSLNIKPLARCWSRRITSVSLQATRYKPGSGNLFVKGQSCNKLGQYSCLKCKTCYCEDHVKRKGFKYEKNKGIPCPKCGYETSQTKDLSMSTRSHKFGRQGQASYDDYEAGGDDYGEEGGYAGYSGGNGYEDQSSDEEEEDSDEEDEESQSDEETDDSQNADSKQSTKPK